MDNSIRIFENNQFGQVRTVLVDNEPFFVGKDVAEILGYANPNEAIQDHVDAEDKFNSKTLSSLGQRGGWFINESGLYSLILSSKLPTARKFKHWVTSEVLPSIRRSGGYIHTTPDETPEQIMAKAVLIAQDTIKRQTEQINQLAPKALFADAVSVSKTSILVGELAKLIKQNGVDIGQNRLFDWLRNNGHLIRRQGTDYNMPTQRSMEMGLFEVKETVITHSDGHTSISKTPKVTGRGQIYFIQKFLGGEAV
jgi:anti-repressor protein